MLLILAAAAFAAATYAEADETGRSYDDAVSCKALSELASNIHNEASKSAMAHIDATIEAEITESKTRDQAEADIEYARFNWKDTTDIATLQAEWRQCVERWKD